MKAAGPANALNFMSVVFHVKKDIMQSIMGFIRIVLSNALPAISLSKNNLYAALTAKNI
jgi:hypothetical protein